jgi:hypothetical protein
MGFQRTFGITTGIGSVLLSLAACGGVGVQSESQTVILGTASTTSTSTATARCSTSTKSSGILDRSGSQQQRDCLHCAP